MPTIQEAMNKVLTEWNKPTEEPAMNETTKNPHLKKNMFGITNNVTRVTFDYVKANPGTTATEAGRALEKQGFKSTSVSGIMAQMARQGLCRKDGFKYYVTQDEYTPLKEWKARNRAKAKAEAVKVEPQPTPQPEAPRPTITVRDIVENMTMRDARALYVELGKYFGAIA